MKTEINGMSVENFLNQPDKEVETELKGRKVTFINGPGESPELEFCYNVGVIQARIETKWGTHYNVLMEKGLSAGNIVQVNSFTKIGIGAYLIKEEEMEIEEDYSFESPDCSNNPCDNCREHGPNGEHCYTLDYCPI